MRARKASICGLLATLVFVGLVCAGAQAATIHVPADYGTIQAAINAASNGDTIIVAPGTYQENINFQGKAITVMSSDGPDVTTIDGGNTASVVVFNTNEGPASILQGFTITNGYGSFDSGYQGGGISVSSASPTIRGNTITANQACTGSGIALHFASPQITGNTITNNSQGSCSGGTGGGGILVGGTSTAQITGNLISGNSTWADGGGISLFSGGMPTIERNIIAGNSAGAWGGGIMMENSSDAIIVDNLISGNSSSRGGGGIAAMVPGPTIVNNTIAGNQDAIASGILVIDVDSQTVIVNNIIVAAAGQTALDCDTSYGSSPPVVQWNDAFSSSGVSYAGRCAGFAGTNGNISADPLFLDSASSNFHLQKGSPAIDAGTNSAPDLPGTDLDGNPRVADGNNDSSAVVDMGAYEFFPTTSTVTPSALSFPDQALGITSASQSVTVANTGAGALLLAVSVTGDFVQTNDCGSSVAAGMSCTVSVSFRPATRGTLTGNLTVVSNTAISPAVVSLSGTAIGPAADISPLNLDFGNHLQGTTSSAQTVTVTDVGELPLSFTNIFTIGDFAQTNTCEGGIAVGASCTVSVTFTPTATGQSVGSLTFTDNAADSPQAVMLTGTGFINPVPLVNEPLVPSSVAPGSSSFTLTVNGTAFVSGATVNWNGSLLTTTFVSGSQLTTTVPASNVATAGTASITVANPGPVPGTSNVVFFPVATQLTRVVFGDAAGSPIGVGNEPRAIAPGDFNSDGKIDMAVANGGENTVSILLGNGDGTFAAAGSTLSTDAGPFSIVARDFDNDGILDLAILNGANLSFFTGHGDGTFTALPPPTVVGSVANSSVAGDFDADGNLDLALANTSSRSVTVLLGNGDGTFSTQASTSSSTGILPSSMATGDFNGDGKLDLAVANNSSNDVTILMGNGDGTFTSSAASLPVGSAPNFVLASDFNDDGKLDLAVANGLTNNVTILLGAGNGNFTALSSEPSTGSGPLSMAAGDLNGDGKLDLAVANSAGNTLTILQGNSDGTFTSTAFSPDTGSYPDSLAPGDFNGDGRLDLATANLADDTVSILLQIQGPVVTFSSNSLSFTGQTVGTTSAPQTVTLTNTGNAGLTISAVAISGANAADFAVSSDSCGGTTVAAGSSCSIGVTFTPSTTGSESASLSFTDNAANSPQSVALTGTSVAPAVTVSPTTLSFSDQVVGTTSAPQTVTLTNTGNADLTISAVAISGANAADFAVSSDSCGGTTVAAGSSCSVSVTFAPSTTGSKSASLDFTDNASNSPHAVGLTGSGAAIPVTASPTSLNFSGQVVGATSAAQTVTVTNNSAATVAISSVTADSDFAETNNCGSSIAAASSCTIDVTFSPTASGSRVGTLSINNSATSSPLTVALAGAGQDFSISARTTSITVSAGGTASYDLMLAPEGGFSGDVSLTCSGAPSNSTCSISPASVTLDGSNSAAVTLKVATKAASATPPLPTSPPETPPMAVFWVSLISMLALGVLSRFLPSRVRARSALLAPLATALLALTFWTACGGGGSTATAVSPGTQAGTYTLTVKSSSGSLSHSTTVSLTVQ